VKRVTAGTTPEGLSYVESIEELPPGESATVFEGVVTLEGAVLPVEPDHAAAWLEPPARGAKWRFAVLPPRDQDPNLGVPGSLRGKLHTTRTVDFTYLVEGQLVLELDVDSVDLEAGDFVILKAANHAWHNSGTTPVKLLALLTNPAAGA
jgi:mannose-6-phosphate isomerase-like protein (cupin superfamily)